MKESKLYIVLRPIVSFLAKILLTPKYEGLENIPKKGRVVLAGNHTHNFDCIILASSTKRPIHFLAKSELFVGIKKILFSNLGLIPVNRQVKDSNVLKTANNYLNNEKVIGIFPEGTTEKGRGLLPFKIGAVKMAKDTNSMIVPFVITGKYTLFSRNLKIKFLKPYKIKNNDLDKENEILRSKIKKELED